jgi:hypothetical protein
MNYDDQNKKDVEDVANAFDEMVNSLRVSYELCKVYERKLYNVIDPLELDLDDKGLDEKARIYMEKNVHVLTGIVDSIEMISKMWIKINEAHNIKLKKDKEKSFQD